MENPVRDVSRIVLPPSSYLHEHEKIALRWPAAVKFIQDKQLNEFFADDAKDFGIIMQGGLYNSVLRSLELLGLANAFGESQVPLYVRAPRAHRKTHDLKRLRGVDRLCVQSVRGALFVASV